MVVSAHWLAQSSQVGSHRDGEESLVLGGWEEIGSLFMGRVGGVTGKSEMPAATLYPKEASLGLRRGHTKWHHQNQTPDSAPSLTFPTVTHVNYLESHYHQADVADSCLVFLKSSANACCVNE